MSDYLSYRAEERSCALDYCEPTIDPILLGTDCSAYFPEDHVSCIWPETDWLGYWAEPTPPTNQLNEPGLPLPLCNINGDGTTRPNKFPGQAGSFATPEANCHQASITKTQISSLGSEHQACTNLPRRGKKNHMLTCTFPGCKHKGTFQRQWELQRHQSSKHKYGQVETYICEALGCFKESSKRAFPRPDKLTSHIRASHKRDTIFERCPIDNCKMGSCSLEVLGLHIRRTHGVRSKQGRAITNAALGTFRKCPWWRCGKYIAVDRFLDHVQTHGADELQIAMLSCNAEGLAADFTQSRPVLSVICPVCTHASEGFEQFKEHIWTAHIFSESSGGSEHFLKWKSHWANHVPKTARAGIENLAPWARLESLEVYGTERDLKCPGCPFAFTQFGKGCDLVEKKRQVASNLRALRSHYEITEDHSVTTHHLSLLRNEGEVIEELHPYRMQILRLYPEFVTHAVFGDLDYVQISSVDKV